MSAACCCGGAIWWTLTKEMQAWCYLQVKLCDPCLSALCVPWCKKALYKYSSFPFLSFKLLHNSHEVTVWKSVFLVPAVDKGPFDALFVVWFSSVSGWWMTVMCACVHVCVWRCVRVRSGRCDVCVCACMCMTVCACAQWSLWVWSCQWQSACNAYSATHNEVLLTCLLTHSLTHNEVLLTCLLTHSRIMRYHSPVYSLTHS